VIDQSINWNLAWIAISYLLYYTQQTNIIILDKIRNKLWKYKQRSTKYYTENYRSSNKIKNLCQKPAHYTLVVTVNTWFSCSSIQYFCFLFTEKDFIHGRFMHHHWSITILSKVATTIPSFRNIKIYLHCIMGHKFDSIWTKWSSII
jgi:hypothetical protein